MKKSSGQLVCQYLERVSRSAIEKHQDIIKEFIRKRHGIYALYKNHRLVYVGLATNLKNRLNTHLRDRHAETWNRFSVYITVEGNKLRELETLSLRIASPANNLITGRFPKAEDLKRKFKKHIQEKQKKELQFIFGGKKFADLPKTVKHKSKEKKGVLAKLVSGPTRIKLLHNGKTIHAHIRRDGIIVLKGKQYSTPTAAAKSIFKYPVSGWIRWKYLRSPGEWVPIDKLRK